VGANPSDIAAPAERESELGVFLRELRERLRPETPALGAHLRSPCRHGRRVTQEEVAEAVGVSRGWYTKLESGARMRATPPLLERLASALMVNSDERERLFQLAVPELHSITLRPDSMAVMERFSLMRSITKRLWAASSEVEALTVVSEGIAPSFPDAEMVGWSRRKGHGSWELYVVDRPDAHVFPHVQKDVASRLTPEEFDCVGLFPQLSQPGEVGTDALLAAPLQQARHDALAKFGRTPVGFLLTRVRTRAGFVGALVVKDAFTDEPSASDCALLSALADLTSLALS
jgi:transcriptional regulator with XRE-family HTH domain